MLKAIRSDLSSTYITKVKITYTRKYPSNMASGFSQPLAIGVSWPMVDMSLESDSTYLETNILQNSLYYITSTTSTTCIDAATGGYRRDTFHRLGIGNSSNGYLATQ